MTKEIFSEDVIDPADVTIVNGEKWINEAGVLKMAFAAAFHGPAQGRRSGKLAMDVVLLAARRKGYAKSDLIASAFSKAYPPSRSARNMANELADFLGSGGVFAAMQGQGRAAK